MGTLQEAMSGLLRRMKGPDRKVDPETMESKAELARKGAKKAADLLPEGMFPHDALKRKGEYYKKVDDIGKGDK
jgi:hypothetical protein